MKKCYYDILEIKKGSSASEIKKAYRKLAAKYHPDKHSSETTENKDEMEAKFKEINEAYQILSDEDKKQKYDRFGHAAFEQGQGNSGGFDFSSFFGGGFGNRQQEGSDIKLQVTITLEESSSGVDKKIRYNKQKKCSSCDGTGAEKGSKIVTCSHCHGAGSIQKTIMGHFSLNETCQHCNGQGSIPEKKCKACHGHKLQNESVETTISIPAGIDEGQGLRVNFGGNELPDPDSLDGDLIVFIAIKQHPIFERSGFDIYQTIDVSFYDSIVGADIEIKTLTATKKIKIPPYSDTGKMMSLKGEGIKHHGTAGNMIIKIRVILPKNLGDVQLKKLKEFNDSL